jgi:hypothetical protein
VRNTLRRSDPDPQCSLQDAGQRASMIGQYKEALMTKVRSEIEHTVSRLMRSAATQYGDTLLRYGDAYAAFGKGDMDAAQAAGAAANLFAAESRKAVEFGLTVASSYAKWVGSLLGVDVLKESAAGSTKAARASTVSKSARRRKSAKG